VEVRAQPDPREKGGIGLLGPRGAEQVPLVVFRALTDLPTEAQPYELARRERDELQAVPEVIGASQVDASQHRPVLVE